MIWIFFKGHVPFSSKNLFLQLPGLKIRECNTSKVAFTLLLLFCCCWGFLLGFFLVGGGLVAKAFPFSQQPMKYFLCRTPILWPLYPVVLFTILPTSSTFLTTMACLAVCYSNPYLTPWPTVHCSLIVPECRLCLLTTKTLPINTQVLRTSRKPPGRPFAQGGGA